MDFEENILALKAKIDEMDIKNCNIIVWGMGHTEMLHESAFENMKINICAYVSSDLHLPGGGKKGCPIITPDQIMTFKNPFVLICVKNKQYLPEIKAQLSEVAPTIKSMMVDEFFFAMLADIVLNNVNLLADEKSKEVYKSIISRRIINDDRMYEQFEENTYFALPMFRMADINEVFIDAGGYVGDTLEKYIFVKYGMFKKYYIFEPDRRNYRALQERIARLKREWNLSEDAVVPILGGVGKESAVLYFKEIENESSTSCYTSEAGKDESKVYALDDFFSDEKVSFIKADIESWELNMLLGAISVLKRDRPKLAISIYHNAFDMCYILDWVNKLNLGYKFYIRHHTPGEADTVLYAYCEEAR